jgi:hypothetical protein
MKWRWLIAVLGLFAGGILVQGPALADTLTISPAADAYVSANLATTNYGASPVMNVGLSGGVYKRIADLKFDLSALSGINTADLLSATLYLNLYYRNPASYLQPAITVSHVDNDAWTEMGVTMSTQPTIGSAIAIRASNPPLGWIAFDLLSLSNAWVAGDLTDGKLSVALSVSSSTGTYSNPSNTDYKFYSRDYATEALRPYLTVVYNPVPVPPTVLLVGSGLLGLVGMAWRRKHD